MNILKRIQKNSYKITNLQFISKMKNSSSFEPESQSYQDSEKNYYKKRAETLFGKLQDLQSSIEDKQANRYRKMFTQIQNLEQDVSKEAEQKKNRYEKILDRVTAVNTRLEDLKIQNEKYLLQLNNVVEKCDKDYGKIFQKIQRDRVKSQDNLTQFINEKISFLLQKFKKKETKLQIQEYLQRLRKIRKQMKEYFQQLQMEESKTKNEFHSTLQHFRSIIKKEFENNDQDDIKRSLKVLHQDITTKVKSMKSKRQQMEENIIAMLQSIVSATLLNAKQP